MPDPDTKIDFVETGLFWEVWSSVRYHWKLKCNNQGRNEVSKGDAIPGRRITAGVQRSPINVTSTLFNTVYLLPKHLRFKHGSAKLASCPGRHL